MRVKPIKRTLTLKPLRPRHIRYHGFFGKTFVKQHMMFDKLWTPDSLTQQFKKMSMLLKKYTQFHILEEKVEEKKSINRYHSLKKECRDGRIFLSRLKGGDPQELQNILKNHRYMQRLYKKMPLHTVMDNINQRTFVMRKERDRLENRLAYLKNIYEKKLIERGVVENRIKYVDEYKLEEDARICDLLKRIENSEVRLKAVRAINFTYKRIIQILRYDEIFYEPILRSLNKDIEDQSQFIRHILYLGSPALVRFKELTEQYKLLDDKARKSNRLSIQQCANFRKINTKIHQRPIKQSGNIIYKVRRYVRETRSMRDLKAQFEEIEELIKKIQMVTLCSQERDIYPRIRSQMNNNMNLGSKIENDMLGHEVLETKLKCASVLKDVLNNNLTEDVIMRLEKIKKLKEAIKREDEFEKQTLTHIKNSGPIFVVLRFSLWNLHDIMRYVNPRRIAHINYPVDYLKLPLLKFEMLTLKACPPEPFEENLSILLKVIQSKLKLLTNALSSDLSASSINILRSSYCDEMINVFEADIQSNQDSGYQIHMPASTEIDVMAEVKSFKKILNRRQIKLASSRIVEEHIKKEE